MKVTYHNVRPATLKLANDFLKNNSMSPLDGNKGIVIGTDLEIEYEYDPDLQSITLEVVSHPATTTPGIILGRIKDLIDSAQESSKDDCDVSHKDGDPNVPSLIKIYLTNKLDQPISYHTSHLTAGAVYWRKKDKIDVDENEVEVAKIQMGPNWTAPYPKGDIEFYVGSGGITFKLHFYGPTDREGVFSIDFTPPGSDKYSIEHCFKNTNCQTIHRVVATLGTSDPHAG